MQRFVSLAAGLAALVGLASHASAADPATRKTENVILLMTDGLRWQEVFNGAEESLISKDPGGVKEPMLTKISYWRESPEERRRLLMPFLWNVVAKQGQIYGNQAKGSVATVTNGHHFSYPGYNETLAGYADPRVDSNNKIPNPNITVFEWLNRKPAYAGKVAAFGVWDVFPYIFNRDRCGFLINAGFEPLTVSGDNPKIEMLNRMKFDTTRYFILEPFDSFTAETAIEYYQQKKPRVFFLSLNETDAWGHEGKYDNYLAAATGADKTFRRLWEIVQSSPELKDKTSILFLPDHGRGDAPVDWKSHGAKIPKSEFIWIAGIGPDTRPLGERSDVPQVTQSQAAATLAAWLGEDYCAAVPQAAKPIADLLPESK